MTFELMDAYSQNAVIKVVGVGGGVEMPFTIC